MGVLIWRESMSLFEKADVNGDGFLNITTAWAPVPY